MYPTFSIPFLDQGFSSFGVMMSLGFLVAYFMTRHNLAHYGVNPRFAPTILVLAIAGGVLGAKLYYATDMMMREGSPWLEHFRRPSGLTWYGGLAGGALGAWIASIIFGVRFSAILDASATALPVGQAIGRLGCFLAGDDYGVRTNVPWAIAFPNGSPPSIERVHPTQLYELIWLLVVAIVLARRRARSPMLFAEYLAANGFGRFWIEFLRLNPAIGLGLTEPQWIALALVTIGSSWLVASARDSSSKLFRQRST